MKCFIRMMVFILAMMLLLMSSVAFSIEEPLYQIVMSRYEGSFIQFMIANFGYAPVVIEEAGTCVYSSPALRQDEVVSVLLNTETVFIALEYASQGASCSALLYELDGENLYELGYVKEYDLSILELPPDGGV